MGRGGGSARHSAATEDAAESRSYRSGIQENDEEQRGPQPTVPKRKLLQKVEARLHGALVLHLHPKSRGGGGFGFSCSSS